MRRPAGAGAGRRSSRLSAVFARQSARAPVASARAAGDIGRRPDDAAGRKRDRARRDARPAAPPPQPVAEAAPAVPVKSLEPTSPPLPTPIATCSSRSLLKQLRPAGAHRAGPARRQPDRRCAEDAARRPDDAAEELDRPALDGLAVARGGRPDAGRGGSGQARERAFLDARSDPAVAAILSRFPGAKIIDVRIPNAPEDDSTAKPTCRRIRRIDPAADDDETDI